MRPISACTDSHPAASASIRAPIQEVLHCPLAFAGVHLLKDLPERSAVAYHYCKDLNADLSQCVLYDGSGPDARLIGVEYLISDALYRKLPSEERAYWHDHRHEIDAGLLRSLTQSGGGEKQTLAKIRTLWGKVITPGCRAATIPAARRGCSGPSPARTRSSSRPTRSSRPS